MTGKKKYLIDYVESFSGSVTFSNGVKNKVVSFGTLNTEHKHASTDNVLNLEGMKANLISIS